MAKTSDAERLVATASNYIIALKGADEGSFVICEPTLVVSKGENWGGLSAEEISTYIKNNKLDAAPLPGRPLHAEEYMAGPGNRPRG
jgi:hypothetical protein